jgi:hypothetical protein
MIITDNSIVATQWDGRCYTCFDLAGRVATYLNDLAAFADYKASL